ncbi:MAG: PRC-barrel domain-containing protein, partial [Balneolales bacterium]
DMEEGRLAFVVVSSSGMSQGQQEGGIGQQQQEQQDQQQQDQQGQQQSGDQYAIIPNALQYDRQQDRVTVDIEKQEFEQAESISGDEWVNPNMEELGYAEVFRYQENGMGQTDSQEDPLGDAQPEQEPQEEDSDWEPNGGESQMQDQPQQDQQQQQQQQRKGHKASDLQGQDVVNQEGESLGSIDDLAIDLQNSRVIYAVIAEGGILGIGEELKVVPPQALTFSAEEESYILDIDEERWADAPTFEDKDEIAQAAGEAEAQEIYAFYGENFQSEDLGFLEEGMTETSPGQTEETESDAQTGPAVQDQQGQQDQQQQMSEELQFTDELSGMTVVSTRQSGQMGQPRQPRQQEGQQQQEEQQQAQQSGEQQEVGEVEEFLIDLEEGRLAFVVLNVSDDFLGQQNGGMGAGQQQEAQPQEGQTPQEGQQGLDQDRQQQQGQQQAGQNNQYAVAPSALRYSQQEEQLTLDIDSQEFMQAERIDSENWINEDQEMLGQNRVFVYSESDDGGQWGATQEGQNGQNDSQRDQEPDGSESQMQDQPQQQDQQQSQQQRKGHKASELKGQDVVNQNGDNLGSIEDLAVDLQNSRVTYAVISEGGVLGVGGELKVVPPQALTYSQEEESYSLDIEEERWAEAPTFQDREEIAQAADETRAQEIYAFYGEEFQSEDLGFLEEGMTETNPGTQGDETESGPAPQAQQSQQQQMSDELQFTSEMMSMTVVSGQQQGQAVQPGQPDQQQDQQEDMQEDQQQDMQRDQQESMQGGQQAGQQEVGEVDEFLVDLEEGRLAFVVLNVSEDFIGQQSGGMETEPQQEDQPQEDLPQENLPQEEGQQGQQDQDRQQQQGQQQQTGDSKYAVAPSALQYSQQEDQLILNIDRQEFSQAERIDSESWIEEDREILGQNRVFRYEEQNGSGQMGAAEGYRQDDATDQKHRDQDTDNETTTGQGAGVVQGQQRGAKVSDLLGNDISNQDGANLGSLNDLAIDLQNSRVVYALVRSGGFLGIGASLRAVPPQAMEFSAEEEQFLINIDEERWDDAPTYDKEELAEMNNESQGSEIYAYFDQEWQDTDLALVEDGAEETGIQDSGSGNPAPAGTITPTQGGGQSAEDQQQGQQFEDRLLFADNLLGTNIISTDMEDIGEVEDLLVDMQEGRAAFAIVNIDEGSMGQAGGQQQGTDDQENQQEMGSNNRYAIVTSAFRTSPEDENELMLEQISQREFEQAQSIDERWMEMDMEVLAENRVFRFQEGNNGTEEAMGTGQQPENGIFRDGESDEDSNN